MGLDRFQRCLAFDRRGTTFAGSRHAAEAEAVTPLEIYAFFILPLIIPGMGFGAYWLTTREAGSR